MIDCRSRFHLRLVLALFSILAYTGLSDGSSNGVGAKIEEVAARRQLAFERLHDRLQKLIRVSEGAADAFWDGTESLNLQAALDTRSPEEAAAYCMWSSNWAMRYPEEGQGTENWSILQQRTLLDASGASPGQPGAGHTSVFHDSVTTVHHDYLEVRMGTRQCAPLLSNSRTPPC